MADKNPDRAPAIPKETPMEHAMRAEFENFYLEFPDAETRIIRLRERIAPWLTDEVMRMEVAKYVDPNKLFTNIEEAARANDKTEFVSAIIKAIEPLLRFQKENPEAFRAFKRRQFVEQNQSIAVNDAFSYRIDEGELKVDVAPVSDFKLADKLSMLRDGLWAIAAVIDRDPSIKIVSATSWIVAENPGLLKKMGFTIEGEIGKELREEHFRSEKRPVHRATMSREDFLKKYLNKKV